MTIHLWLFANSKEFSYLQGVNKPSNMNCHSQSNFTGSPKETQKSDISVHKVSILIYLWGVGSGKRHHHNSQDQRSTLLDYLEASSPKIVCPGKKQMIEVLMLRQNRDTEVSC